MLEHNLAGDSFSSNRVVFFEIVMDHHRNPFALGAGSMPPQLAGRDAIIDSAKIACGRSIRGRSARSIMLFGLRGTGKTVLLKEIGDIAEEAGLLVSRIDVPERESLARVLYPEMHRVMRSLSDYEPAKQIASRGLKGLRSFASIFKIGTDGTDLGGELEPGLADSGDIHYDLTDIFAVIGEAARAVGKGWILLIDEIQDVAETDLSALIATIHRMSQDRLPVLLVGAGLPQTARLVGGAKPYAERLFLYHSVGALDRASAVQAILKPIEDEEASIEPSAIGSIVDLTRGFPFFLQHWASAAWDYAEGPNITADDVDHSYAEALASLDAGFFGGHIALLTRSEVQFVKLMADLGDSPYAMADIAKAMERTQSSTGQIQSGIISKGLIYRADHGYLDFTVPFFAEYLRRTI